MSERVVRRLNVLREDADREPTPQRKYFHIGEPEVLDDLGECVPMISWIDDNLSRYVVADGSSTTWGKTARIFALPNHAVKLEDGIFLITGPGDDSTMAHPNGKGRIHFIHLGCAERIWVRKGIKIYVYKLEG